MAIIAISGKSNSGKDLVGSIIQYLTHAEGEISKEYFREFTGNSTYNKESFSGWQIKKFAEAVNTSYKTITGIDFHSLSREDKELERPKFIEFAEGCKDIFYEDVWIDNLFSEYKETTTFIGKAKYTGKHDLQGNSLYELPDGRLINIERYSKQILPTYPNWAITDLRKLNEYKAVKDRGGIVIRVNRDLWAIKDAQDVVHTYNSYEELYTGMFNVWRDETIKEKVYKVEGDTLRLSESELAVIEPDYILNNNGSVDDLIIKVKEILIKEKII